MAAPRDVTFRIRAIDRTRAVFRRVRRGLRGLGRLATGVRARLVALTAGGITVAISRLGDLSDQLLTTSRRFDQTTKETQALRFIAGEAGQNVNAFNTVLQRVSRRADEARKGNRQLADSFRDVGIPFEELESVVQRPFTALERLISAAARGDLQEVFRVSDTEGLQLLDAVAARFGTLQEGFRQFERRGFEISEESLKSFDRASDLLQKIKNDLLELIAVPALEFFAAQLPNAILATLDAVRELVAFIRRAIEGFRTLRQVTGNVVRSNPLVRAAQAGFQGLQSARRSAQPAPQTGTETQPLTVRIARDQIRQIVNSNSGDNVGVFGP